jgi:aspartate ammonia-lyase
MLGAVLVPAEALYGAQTRRAVVNFPLRGQRALGDFPPMVRALVLVKQAAALANRRARCLDEHIADAIVAAGGEVLERALYDEFPIHHLHGGGGTSANMNANEVLANLAEERLGGRRGEYRLAHPNEHVNRNQSTNDVYPTACRVAVLLRWPEADADLCALTESIRVKAGQLAEEKRIARTCLQDAVAVTFGDLLGGYATLLERGRARVSAAVDDLHAVNLGGSIIGRIGDVPAAYADAVMPALREMTGDPAYARSADLFDAAQNLDDLVRVSGELNVLARGLIKVCRDLRLMSSGPEAGLGEIRLPAMQPGSSAMPGKVNPVMPEHAIQLCLKATGLHAGCQAALDHGELDLNVWESLVTFGVLESMELVGAGAQAVADRCIGGLEVVRERNDANVRTIIPLLTDLTQRHGYAAVTAIVKKAGNDPATLRRLLSEAFPDDA